MDLSRQSDAEKLNLCRKYFFFGFALLPFVWIVNVVWFLPHVITQRAYEEKQQLKKYVIGSGVGAVFWIVLLLGWQIIFQTYRVSWGAVGDALSFTVPVGRP